MAWDRVPCEVSQKRYAMAEAMAKALVKMEEKEMITSKEKAPIQKNAVEGHCPYCDSTDLDYAAGVHKDDIYEYSVTCRACGRSFDELYALSFSGQHLDNDTDLEIG